MKSLNELCLTILYVLSKKSLTGYDLCKSPEVSVLREASYQQVYRECKSLHTNGYLEFKTVFQPGKPSKKIYSITELGLGSINNSDRNLTTELQPLRSSEAVQAMLGNAGHLKAQIAVLDGEIEQLKFKAEEDALDVILRLAIRHKLEVRQSQLRFCQRALSELSFVS